MLPWKDSNSHKRNQNPVCYHYTTRQFLNLFSVSQGLFPFDDAKLLLFYDSTKFFGKKISTFFIFFWTKTYYPLIYSSL